MSAHRKAPRRDKTLTRAESAVAVSAYMRGGAGAHGGGKRQHARRDRQEARRALRGGWDG